MVDSENCSDGSLSSRTCEELVPTEAGTGDPLSRCSSAASTPSVLDLSASSTDSADNDESDIELIDSPRMVFCLPTPLSYFGRPLGMVADYAETPTDSDESSAANQCKPCSDEQGVSTSNSSSSLQGKVDKIMEDIRNCLLSSNPVSAVSIEKGVYGKSGTSITSAVQDGADAFARSYKVLHAAKNALEGSTASQRAVSLLSARMHKESHGYSLRSTIACVPESEEQRVCWDMFQKGFCPRRQRCQWHHPMESDTVRIKISVRHLDMTNISEPSQHQPAATGKCALSLSNLL